MTDSTENYVVRSSKEIKARLLRNAWMTGAAAHIISEIQLRHKRIEEMPEGHREALFHLVPGQDPALMRINLRNYLSGHTLFSSPENVPAPKVATGDMNPKRYETHEIYEQLVAEKKRDALAPDFLLLHGAQLLAEDIGDAAATGRPYYADDLALNNFTVRNKGELNLSDYTDVHEPYIDRIYQARQDAHELKPIFGEAAHKAIEENYYADDAYLEKHAEKTGNELDLTPHDDVLDPYQDDAYQAKGGDLSVEEYLRDIFGGELPVDPFVESLMPTALVHEKLNEAHSPYIDAFFEAARWGNTVDGVAVDDETRHQAKIMDMQASVKPKLILQ